MERPYLERVKEVVTINKPLYSLTEDKIWEMMEEAKPVIFDGHFELLSLKHSDIFFRFAALTHLPQFVNAISNEFVEGIKRNIAIPERIDGVLGVASQGMFLAFDLASKLGTRVLYVPISKNDGKAQKELIKGFTLPEDSNILIVNDLTTTGNGIVTLESLALEKGAKVVGMCIFANRGVQEQKVQALKEKYGDAFRSILDLKMKSWPKDVCELCNVKPLVHSKQIHHLAIYSSEKEYDLYVKQLEEMFAR